jgi:hypothetical protein
VQPPQAPQRRSMPCTLHARYATCNGKDVCRGRNGLCAVVGREACPCTTGCLTPLGGPRERCACRCLRTRWGSGGDHAQLIGLRNVGQAAACQGRDKLAHARATPCSVGPPTHNTHGHGIIYSLGHKRGVPGKKQRRAVLLVGFCKVGKQGVVSGRCAARPSRHAPCSTPSPAPQSPACNQVTHKQLERDIGVGGRLQCVVPLPGLLHACGARPLQVIGWTRRGAPQPARAAGPSRRAADARGWGINSGRGARGGAAETSGGGRPGWGLLARTSAPPAPAPCVPRRPEAAKACPHRRPRSPWGHRELLAGAGTRWWSLGVRGKENCVQWAGSKREVLGDRQWV